MKFFLGSSRTERNRSRHRSRGRERERGLEAVDRADEECRWEVQSRYRVAAFVERLPRERIGHPQFPVKASVRVVN